jgi:Zn-dependent protease
MRRSQPGPALGARRVHGSGWRLMRVAGIDIHLDTSLLVIFLLIAFTLGTGLFPRWHPDWSAALAWAAAAAAALLFFTSVLLHELAHALVARRHGIAVPRITLFIFGGMAQMEDEPATWRGEFWMALAGPALSVALGVSCALLAVKLAGPGAIDAADIERSLGRIGVAPTLALWLAQVNLLLAVFNMLPGFPLDGGRVLRALLWGISGNLRLATRWAAGAGQLFAALLIGAGAAMILGRSVPLLGSGLVGGLWVGFIGAFLYNAARASYRQLLARESLRDVPVERLMQTALLHVAPEWSVARLVDEGVLHSDQRAFPVLREGHMVGMVSLDDVRRLARADWPARTVAEIMTPLEALVRVAPQEDAQRVMNLLGKASVNQIAVLEQDQLRGLIRREDIFKWLALNLDRKTASAFSQR